MGVAHCATCGLTWKEMPAPGASCPDCGTSADAPGALVAGVRGASGRVPKPVSGGSSALRMLLAVALITPVVVVATVYTAKPGYEPGPVQPPTRPWTTMRDQAYELMRAGKTDLAIEQLKLVLGLTKSARATDEVMRYYRELAQIYREKKLPHLLIPLWKDAVAYYEAIAGDPYRLAQSWQDLSCAEVEAGDLKSALEHARKADSLYPKSKHTYARSNHEQCKKNIVAIEQDIAAGK